MPMEGSVLVTEPVWDPVGCRCLYMVDGHGLEEYLMPTRKIILFFILWLF